MDKKKIVYFIIAVITGITIGKYVYDSYNKTETKDVFKYKNENVYMLQYGVYSSEENMINNTKNLKNYFYFKDNDYQPYYKNAITTYFYQNHQWYKESYEEKKSKELGYFCLTMEILLKPYFQMESNVILSHFSQEIIKKLKQVIESYFNVKRKKVIAIDTSQLASIRKQAQKTFAQLITEEEQKEEEVIEEKPQNDLDKYSDEELARKVINGDYGNGQDRKNALGDRYNAVQSLVNKILNGEKQEEKPDILLMVKKTIRGDYGNGQDRKNALGKYYDEVQHQVNLNLRDGRTRWDNIKLY